MGHSDGLVQEFTLVVLDEGATLHWQLMVHPTYPSPLLCHERVSSLHIMSSLWSCIQVRVNIFWYSLEHAVSSITSLCQIPLLQGKSRKSEGLVSFQQGV